MTIDKNLTLEGITVGTANQAVITSPVGGVVNNAIDPASGSPVQAQIVATGGAKVNISDLVVDGTGNGLAGCSWNLVGIYYEDASGVINHVVRDIRRRQTLVHTVGANGDWPFTQSRTRPPPQALTP